MSDGIDPQALLGAAERVVAQALARGAEQAEVYWEQGRHLDIEIQEGRIHGTEASAGGGAGLRIVKDARLGFAYFTQADQAARAIEQALAAARLAPAKGFTFPSHEAAKPIAGRWNDDVAALDVELAIGLAGDLLRGAEESCPDGLVSGGGVGLDAGATAIANSNGLAVVDRATSAHVSASVVLEDGQRSVSAGDDAVRRDLKLDAAEVGREAGRVTASLAAPAKADRLDGIDVVFRPHAVSELLGMLAVNAAMGDEAMRGRSVWTGKRGQEVASSRLSIVDDPYAPGAIGSVAFDDEGRATRRLPIVERGILKTFLFDGWDALQHGETPTASAARSGFKGRPETSTHHLVVEDSGALPLERLLGGVQYGILVDQVLGAHTANTTTGEFSVTSPGLWRIEDGQVRGALSEVAIAGSLDTLLRGFGGASVERKSMGGGQIPHILVRGLRVSS